MGIKRQELEIIVKLMDGSYSVRDLSDYYKQSERKIRYLLENINYYLDKFLDITVEKSGKNYLINIDKEHLQDFIKKVSEYDYVYTSKERSEIILFHFLFRDQVKLRELEEILDITRATLKKDIYYLNEELSIYKLELKLINNQMIILGNEKKIRHLMMLKVLEYIGIEGVNYPLTISLERLLPSNNLKFSATSIVKRIEKLLDKDISREFKRLITAFIWVTLIRIDRGIIIDRKHNSEFLKGTIVYNIINKVLEEFLQENYKYEALHLSEYFLSEVSKGKRYEEELGIELFIYHLLINRDEFLMSEENVEAMTDYLSKAYYRMKNNFLLNTDTNKNINSEFSKEVHNLLINNDFLSESLRLEEIISLERFIDSKERERKEKSLRLEELIDVVKECSGDLNEEKLRKKLLERYSSYLFTNNRIPMSREFIIKASDFSIDLATFSNTLSQGRYKVYYKMHRGENTIHIKDYTILLLLKPGYSYLEPLNKLYYKLKDNNF